MIRWFATLLILFISQTFQLTAQDTKHPNILFLLADDMRPDCISAPGNPRIQTPHLDELISRGMTFTRATCSYPICVVSRAEMLTGCHGWENGVTGIRGSKPDLSLTTWPEALRDSGYLTWHVGKWHIAGRPSTRGYTAVAGLFSGGGSKYWKEGQTDWKGFPITGYRGWIFQSDDGKTKFPDLGVGVTPGISEKFADAAISLIEQNPDEPWFCHVNFTAPHDPLFIPPGMEGKYSPGNMELPENYMPVHPFDHGNFDGRDEALLSWPRTEEAVKDLLHVYYSVIEDMDTQIGRILEAVEKTGKLGNTIVIFTSDHGMSCGSHGLRGKQNMYEHTINVPFIIAGPHIAPNSTTGAQVYLRELFPTTCELAGIPIPESVTSQSFASVALGEKKGHHEYIYGYFADTQRMIRSQDSWKLIHYPQIDHWQFFDLNTDPHELNNLAISNVPQIQEKYASFRHRLKNWRRNMNDPALVD